MLSTFFGSGALHSCHVPGHVTGHVTGHVPGHVHACHSWLHGQQHSWFSKLNPQNDAARLVILQWTPTSVERRGRRGKGRSKLPQTNLISPRTIVGPHQFPKILEKALPPSMGMLSWYPGSLGVTEHKAFSQ